jgi:hypothetical protein
MIGGKKKMRRDTDDAIRDYMTAALSWRRAPSTARTDASILVSAEPWSARER